MCFTTTNFSFTCEVQNVTVIGTTDHNRIYLNKRTKTCGSKKSDEIQVSLQKFLHKMPIKKFRCKNTIFSF